MLQQPCQCGPECLSSGWCLDFASIVVQREGKILAVCSHCSLSSDTKVGRLYEASDIPGLWTLDQDMTHAEPAAAAINSLGNVFAAMGTTTTFHDYLSLPLVPYPTLKES